MKKETCCDKPKQTTSVSTRKGRRSICNNCGKPWKIPSANPSPYHYHYENSVSQMCAVANCEKPNKYQGCNMPCHEVNTIKEWLRKFSDSYPRQFLDDKEWELWTKNFLEVALKESAKSFTSRLYGDIALAHKNWQFNEIDELLGIIQERLAKELEL